jgi:hypothetical protein
MRSSTWVVDHEARAAPPSSNRRRRDRRFLYALDTDGRRLHAWRVREDGRLEEAASTGGLPVTAAGLAVR